MAFLAGLIGELGTSAAAGEAATAGTAAAAESSGAGEAISAAQFGEHKEAASKGVGDLLSSDNLNVGKGAEEGASSIKGALTKDYGSPSMGEVGARLRNLNGNQFG